MPEVRQPLLPVDTNYVCDSCGKGYMVRVKARLETVSPEGFMHQCNYCETETQLPEIYPIRHYVNFYGFLQDAKAVITEAKKRNDRSDANAKN